MSPQCHRRRLRLSENLGVKFLTKQPVAHCHVIRSISRGDSKEKQEADGGFNADVPSVRFVLLFGQVISALEFQRPLYEVVVAVFHIRILRTSSSILIYSQH